MLNHRGKVIGVSVLTIRDGQNLNFAIPSNYLKNLLAKVRYTKLLSQAKSVKGQQSLLAGCGFFVSKDAIATNLYSKGLDLSNLKVDEQIAFFMSIIIGDGKNPSDYNIVDPTAKRPEGTYRVRIIDYETLPDYRII